MVMSARQSERLGLNLRRILDRKLLGRNEGRRFRFASGGSVRAPRFGGGCDSRARRLLR
jgi:hypothetical protein